MRLAFFDGHQVGISHWTRRAQAVEPRAVTSWIDAQHPIASWFLLGSAIVFGVVFALPLLVVPLRWARVFQWPSGPQSSLTVYFGRCLGGLATALVIAVLRAVPAPAEHLPVIDMAMVATGLMTVVHVVGAIERSQPWTETVEIGVYAAMTAALFWVRTSVGG
jgi:hypothetical protein